MSNATIALQFALYLSRRESVFYAVLPRLGIVG